LDVKQAEISPSLPILLFSGIWEQPKKRKTIREKSQIIWEYELTKQREKATLEPENLENGLEMGDKIAFLFMEPTENKKVYLILKS